MGGRFTKAFRERSSSFGGSPPYGSSAWNSSSYGPQCSSDSYVQPETKNKLQRRYSRISDNYDTLDKVTAALAQAGLESSNLIVGIDFTKSNEWTGAKSFNRRSLHHLGDGPNPYEQAISIIGRTLSAFDEDNLIPCFGFGDASTHDQQVFSFYPNDRLCNGFEEALSRYREIVPQLRLAGPTSFAPIIEAAIRIVEQSGGQYHVLLIIADGQVTRSVDTDNGHLSPQEQNTVNAIVQASEYPLSIVLVGVGDGPWDMMRQFDDNIPARSFDNFQFVNFTEIMSKNVPVSKKEAMFALAALMEIPSQYKATLELQMLGCRRGKMPDNIPLPPPFGNGAHAATKHYSRSESFQTSSPQPYGYNSQSFGTSGPQHYGYNSPSFETSSPQHYGYNSPSFETSSPRHYGYSSYERSAPPAAMDTVDGQSCPICLTNPKDLAFGCGHQTCYDCGQNINTCPICRSEITTRIKLY